MATFKICVFEHQKRADGKYPVSIRVCWKRKYGYIKSEYYVTAKQIDKKTFTLKDVFIINDLNKRIIKYEDIKVKKLGHNIEMYTAKELADYFKQEGKPGTDSTIDFIKFSREHIEKLKLQGRKSTADPMQRTINMVVDFCNGRENVGITEITSKFLTQFEAYLKTERTMSRKDQFGRMVKTKKKGLADVSIIDYMTDIRTLFNAAVDEFNDEDRDDIRILHYPFRKYKLKKVPESEKRNLTAEQLTAIRDVDEQKLQYDRATFSRDVFLLSFFLVGMNFADMYGIDTYKDGRLSYERQKTRGRRQDRAFISIKVEPEVLPIIEKYRDPSGVRVFDFYKRYSTSHIFSSNVNKGLKQVATACEIEEALSTYWARHTWATLARNKCDVSKDDVDLALNHIDQGRKMADVYIEKDFSRIDNANRAVLDLLKK